MRPGMLILCWMAAAAGWAAEVPTGVIVDACHLDPQRCRFPRLLDPDETSVYPSAALLANKDYRAGFCGYKAGLTSARADRARVGERPLVVRPEAVYADDPVGGSLVLTAADATLLREANQRFGLLDKDRLVIVIGLGVKSATPADACTTAAPEAAVVVELSKSLDPDCLERLTPLRVTRADGQAVAGRLACDAATGRLEFVPAQPLQAGAAYTVVVAKGLRAETGGVLEADVVIKFTVAPPAVRSETTAPADNPTNEPSPVPPPPV
ncbi:MAG: Ig-like domain-containing protein [Fimbriimonadaceae bacterium]|nr:Ig-like domain-containing protein [Fimbriimonadaceae bacterium]